MNRVYLDWAASAPPEEAAIQEAAEVSLSCFGNPSSPHSAGKEAAERLEDARGRFAALIEASPGEIVFTSGGTESNTSLLLSVLNRYRLGGAERRKARIVTTAVEHASVHDQALGLETLGMSCTVVKPGPNGIVDPQAIGEALDEETVLVSVMLVNNETGAIQRIPEISRLVHEHSARRGRRIIVHTDAVQALGKVPVSVAALGVDAASFSAHKIGGPRGVGALYLRSGVAPGFLSIGGGQEAGRRPGTENVAGACALAAAAEQRAGKLAENRSRAANLMERLVSGLKEMRGSRIIPESRTGRDAGAFSPYILSAGFPPLTGEIVVRVSDARGFFIATGSACSTKKKDRTRVPESMGLDHKTALSAIRISLGPSTTESEIDAFLAMLNEEIPPLLSISQGRGENSGLRGQGAGMPR
ncbi:MAG: cysteine desulfurase family protein [Spirochaetia bacterium]|jgi:cysteine desulfurase